MACKPLFRPAHPATLNPACYLEIGMRLALNTQATFLLAGQQALLFEVVLNFL
jgi:hypothetical protein